MCKQADETGKGRGVAGALAQTTGDYLEHLPQPELRATFACIWTHRLPSGGEQPIVVVPDATIDLQWIGGKFRIAGPDITPQSETIAAGATVVGFRFRPAAAAAWIGVEAAKLVGQRVALEDVWGSKARQMADSVREQPCVEAAIRELQAILTRFGPELAVTDKAMRAAYDLVAAGPPAGASLVPWLGRSLGMSERTLRRRFDESFGYGPKTLERILRHQRFLRLARGPTDASTALLAAEAGYSDQAHLVRESRRLTGLTPSELRHTFGAG